MEIAQAAEMLSKAKLVGLGESTHGTHEFFNFKSELFRQLVTDHGFNTLLFEDSQKACRFGKRLHFWQRYKSGICVR